MADSQIDRNSIRKNIYCWKLILLQSFYCLKLNMLSRRIITLFSQCVMNLFIHLLLNCLCYLSLAFKLFLTFSKICKEYKGAFTFFAYNFFTYTPVCQYYNFPYFLWFSIYFIYFFIYFCKKAPKYKFKNRTSKEFLIK